MERVASRELLDSDAGSPAEIAASLSDLRKINRRFGGVSVTESLIAQVIRETGNQSLTMLEVAAGRGDVVKVVAEKLGRQGVRISATLLDRSAVHLSHTSKQMSAVAADALSLPFADSTFDIVSSCLFTHHLSEAELVKFMNEGLRVAKNAVIVNDILRNRLHLALTYLGFPLYSSRLTRNDAPASVRQAYTAGEMTKTLRQTRAARVEIRRHYLFRIGAIAWKR